MFIVAWRSKACRGKDQGWNSDPPARAWLSVDRLHCLGIVAIPGGSTRWQDVVDPGEIFRRQTDVDRAEVGFETAVLPRRVTHSYRFARLFYSTSWTWWRALASRLPEGKWREAFLSLSGPLSLLGLLATWVFGLIVGFAPPLVAGHGGSKLCHTRERMRRLMQGANGLSSAVTISSAILSSFFACTSRRATSPAALSRLPASSVKTGP
jgi:hypothetical protein